MEPILTIDNLNSFGGNMLRQGDKSQLKYRLRDVGNKNLGISGKSCQVKMYGRNYTTVVYETTTTVSSDNTVSFTINKVLPKGTFYLEFTVGDYIFPTDHREFFEITPSGKGMESNIIEIVGVDAVVRKAIDLINDDPNLIIDEDRLVGDIISNTGLGSIEEYYQQFSDVIKELSEEKEYHSLPEIAGARGGHDTLGQRLDETTAQLAQTDSVVLEGKNAADPLPIPTYVFADQAVHPSVVYIQGGVNGYKYWMAMTPYPSSNDIYENPSILASNDGMVWVVPAGLINPIDKPSTQEIADNKHMSDTHLLYVNGRLEVYYRMSTRDTAYDWIFRKTSSDGINWSERELIYESETDGDYILSPALVYDGVYKMWFVDMSGNIWYTTSVDFQTWSERTKINVDYHANYKAWHLDVQKIDNKYHLMINAIRNGDARIRDMLYVYGTNEHTFGKTITLLVPSSTGWDSGFIYRGSLVKVDSHYRLYYSAFGNNRWGIGLISGNSIETMQDVSIVRKVGLQAKSIATDVLVGTNNKKLSVVSNETRFTTDKGTLPVIKFVENGGTGASLRLKNNGFDIYANNDTSLGGITLGGLVLTSISSPNTLIDFYKTPRIVSDRGTKPKIVFLESGVATAELRSGTDAMEIGDSSGLNFGNLKLGKIIVSDSSSAPVEGAIRYNSTTKKHQGWNGSTWNDMY